MGVVNVDCSHTMLGRIVAGPLDIGGAKNRVLFCDFFDLMVGVLEIKFDSGGDLAKSEEAGGKKRAGDSSRVEPVACISVALGASVYEDGADSVWGDAFEGSRAVEELDVLVHDRRYVLKPVECDNAVLSNKSEELSDVVERLCSSDLVACLWCEEWVPETTCIVGLTGSGVERASGHRRHAVVAHVVSVCGLSEDVSVPFEVSV